jgi:hypothetical protein
LVAHGQRSAPSAASASAIALPIPDAAPTTTAFHQLHLIESKFNKTVAFQTHPTLGVTFFLIIATETLIYK